MNEKIKQNGSNTLYFPNDIGKILLQRHLKFTSKIRNFQGSWHKLFNLLLQTVRRLTFKMVILFLFTWQRLAYYLKFSRATRIWIIHAHFARIHQMNPLSFRIIPRFLHQAELKTDEVDSEFLKRSQSFKNLLTLLNLIKIIV